MRVPGLPRDPRFGLIEILEETFRVRNVVEMGFEVPKSLCRSVYRVVELDEDSDEIAVVHDEN
jgi:hypothetical protein